VITKGGSAVVTDVAKNLIRIRSVKDLTQEEVAFASDISLAGYRKIESGESAPRASTVLALAKALDVKPGDVLRPAPKLPRARFRSTKRMRERDLLLMDVAEELGSYVELETLLGESDPFDPTVIKDKVNDSEMRAVAMAASVRDAFRLRPDEVIRDICGLLEDHGVKVLRKRVASDAFFGLSVWGDLGPAIVVNIWDRISVERWIFTAAHELGHLVLHAADFDAEESVEDPSHEKEADLFAAHFLMPDDAFHSEWDQAGGLGLYERVMKVKRIFRVSYKTVLYRLHQEGRTDIWARFNIDTKRRLGKTLPRIEEPDALEAADFVGPVEGRKGQEPTQLTEFDFVTDRRQRLVRQAVEADDISIGRAAEILRVRLREMREIAGSWY
jgi:Zn-dependent peptidase ImmA (M78 family)/DNA-binding XRE family transcriptional regulator